MSGLESSALMSCTISSRREWSREEVVVSMLVMAFDLFVCGGCGS